MSDNPRPVRELAPELARIAIFVIKVGPIEDNRKASEKTVASCEGGSCVLQQPDVGQGS